MITPEEARNLSYNSLEDLISEQRKSIYEDIERGAHRGDYAIVFYGKEIYPRITEELKHLGFKIESLTNSISLFNVYKAIKISWNE